MAHLSRLAEIHVGEVKGLSGKRGAALHRAGIHTVADLLVHVPRTYIDRSRSTTIEDLTVGEEVTVVATVRSVSVRRPRRKLAIVEAKVTDGTSSLKAVWFNQTFRVGQLSTDSQVALSGKVERFKGTLQMKSPAVDVLSSPTESLDVGRIVPIHPAVGEASPGVLRRALHNALRRSRPIPDSIPADIVSRADVTERDWAYGAIHFPERIDDVPAARRRLVFDELFRLEVALAMQKRAQEEASNGIAHRSEGRLMERFFAGLPYELTGAQRRVLGEIRTDLARSHAMHRLLQGEVGSGKTVVAVATLLAGVEGGWQGAVMAPTEVLAEQHYLAITELLHDSGMLAGQRGEGATLGMESLFGDDDGIAVALLTGSRAVLSTHTDAARDDVVAAIGAGEVELVVGTHTLIQEGLRFADLGVAVVDEQHRFGVAQRVQLRDKADGLDPDLLIMTATPIPRTLSMTLYGDLEESVIDEMPPGRTPVETVYLGGDEARAWKTIRSEVEEGRQAFVVCPLVEDSPKVEASSATAEYERLRDVFEDFRVGLIHGQLHPRDKEAVMDLFRSGDVDVLVTTTVIEVGIDVPNATVMVIEDAHRFGLSQLHQLRGRVGRGRHRGTCLLLGEPTTEEGEARISALVSTTDGFELALEDLAIRGQGTVFGERQSGLTDLRLADIVRDHELLRIARREAFALVDQDPALTGHRDLATEIRSLLGEDVAWLFVS